jgi:hypothetical protein
MAYKYIVTLHLNKLLDDMQQILQIIYYHNNTKFTQNWYPGIIQEAYIKEGGGVAESV